MSQHLAPLFPQVWLPVVVIFLKHSQLHKGKSFHASNVAASSNFHWSWMNIHQWWYHNLRPFWTKRFAGEPPIGTPHNYLTANKITLLEVSRGLLWSIIPPPKKKQEIVLLWNILLYKGIAPPMSWELLTTRCSLLYSMLLFPNSCFMLTHFWSFEDNLKITSERQWARRMDMYWQVASSTYWKQTGMSDNTGETPGATSAAGAQVSVPQLLNLRQLHWFLASNLTPYRAREKWEREEIYT